MVGIIELKDYRTENRLEYHQIDPLCERIISDLSVYWAATTTMCTRREVGACKNQHNTSPVRTESVKLRVACALVQKISAAYANPHQQEKPREPRSHSITAQMLPLLRSVSLDLSSYASTEGKHIPVVKSSFHYPS